MELIPYDEFRRLRLKQFCPPGTEIDDLGEDSEYMGRTWTGEGIKGVDFLWQRKNTASSLACIILALQPKFCPPEVEQAILATIRLPLKRGMTLTEVKQLLGKPAVQNSGKDWDTVEFRCGRKSKYMILTDFGSTAGLRNLHINRWDALPDDDEKYT